MKKITIICLGWSILCGGMGNHIYAQNSVASKYDSKSIYNYNNEISKESKIINDSLKKAIDELIVSLKTEKRSMLPMDRRILANKFFVKHAGIGPEVNISNFSIENKNDHYQIPVRLYEPSKESNKLIVFIHGGGWMQGNIDTHDSLCRYMAFLLDCKVISVDYRLAPEFKFPVGLEDVQSVYQWCANSKSKSKLGKIKKIYIAGDSAGGNLSAALNLKLKKDNWKGHSPDGLLLFYPVVSNKINSASFKIFKEQTALTSASMIAFIEQYIDQKVTNKEVANNELIFPLNGAAKDFPDTFIIAAESDVLLDGQIDLYNKLKKHNIPVELYIEKGAVHGFMSYCLEFKNNVIARLDDVKKWLDKG